MNDFISFTLIPLMMLGVLTAWVSWAVGIRRFLKRNGRPYQQSVNIRSGGGGMIQDVIELLEHCRGRCPLPVSFWFFMFGFCLSFLSLAAAIVIPIFFGDA